MKIKTLDDLWITGIRYTLDFETKIAAGSPAVTAAATLPEVRAALTALEGTTAALADDLRAALDALGEQPAETDNQIARGMLAAVTTMIDLSEPGPVRDAAILVELNQQQLYRVATYGSMLGYARLLGRRDVLTPLKDALARSREADRMLSDLAVDVVNPAAMR